MRLQRLVLGSGIIVGMALALTGSRPALAYTAAQLNLLFPSPSGYAVAQEQNCTNNLNAQLPGTTRTDVNNSGPYVAATWISALGSPSVNTITVPYGATTVPLQLNQMEILCSILVQNSDPAYINPNYTWDHTAEIKAGNFPNDRAPVPGDGASLYETSTHIDAASIIAGSGTILSSPAGKSYKLLRDNTSRYWFSNTEPTFTYDNTSPGGFTSSETVLISVTTRSISGFHQPPGTVYQCLGQPNLPNDTAFSSCPPGSTTFAINIVVQAPVILTTSGSGNVVAGSTYPVNVALKNPSSSSPSLPGNLQIMLPATGAVAPAVYGPTPAMTNLGTVSIAPTHGYRAASVIPGVVGKNWDWPTTPIPVSALESGILNVTITPGTPAGTVINMEVYFYPPVVGGAPLHQTVTFTVISSRAPVFSSANSDVHAGGALGSGSCTAAPGSGNVTVNPGIVAQSQYAVSGYGAIDGNVNSNNAMANTLKLGTFGSYAVLCRPDLLAAANLAYPGAGVTLPAGVNDLTLNSTSAGVIYYNGGNLTVHGTVGGVPGLAPVTIVARAGSVEISGDITLNNTKYPRSALPSLGVIAAGNITIDPAVTLVNAYLFADGYIDTCDSTHGACSTPVLNINGFLMGKNILFDRLGPFNSDGSVVAENVVFAPQIYLNPPKFFDGSVDNISLQGQGERAPLF